MRPTRTTLLVICWTFLAPQAVRAQGSSTPGGAVLQAAGQALSPADIPSPAGVPPADDSVEIGEPDAGTPVGAVDEADASVIADEVEQESAELEDLRQAEQASHVQDAAGWVRAGTGFDGLGLESPLRDRVDGALGRGEVIPEAERIALLPELDIGLEELRARYDIPIDVNAAVVAYIRFFQSPRGRRHFVKWLGRSHKYVEKYRAILREEGVPEDTVFLAMIESGFGNFAYSHAKASGPWQFIPATGKHFGLDQDFWVDERRDPEKSARAAARYLKLLHKQVGGDWRLAWAGYNAGPGRISGAKRKGYTDFWEMAKVPGKSVLADETKGYVPKLMAAAIIWKHQEAFGFRPEEIEPQAWTDYVEVPLQHATLVSVLAKAAGASEREIIELNPELRRVCTPPRPYKVKIPRARAETFARAWPALKAKNRMTFAGHVIRRGDTLSGIALRHGVPVDAIKEMNGIKSARRLRIGQELLIPKPVGAAVAAARAPARRGAQTTRARAVTQAVAAKAPPQKAARTTLEVKSGDTLWSISQRYGVDLATLCRWNGISDPDRHKLMVGARLVVYAERG